MAAPASSKPVGLQVTLIFFVLTTLVFGVLTYTFHRSYSEAQRQMVATGIENGNLKKMAGDSARNVEALQALIGLKMETVEGENDDPTTVSGGVRSTISKAGPYGGNDLVTTVDKLLQAYGATEEERANIAKNLNEQNEKVLSLETQYDAKENQHRDARLKAEADLQDLIKNRDELLAAKDKEVDDWRKKYQDTRADLDNRNEELKKARERHAEEITRLEGINNKLNDDLDQLKQQTFEVADGYVRRVDYGANRVWVSLGRADHVRERITFSVYDRDNSALGRGQSDIKGTIEITQVIDDHLSEAKITSDSLTRPMTPGDQIYSPLWSPGRMEYFSFVGTPDIDNDGTSDRKLLHEIIKIAGAEIDNEVDEAGNRTGDGITEQTKFLVLGDIPDPAKFAEGAPEKANALRVSQQLKDLRKEARLNGVRIINMNDFLSFIGYKPKRRLFRPGQERPFNLRAGAHSTAVNEPLLKGQQSTGNVSGAYSGNKNKPQAISPGTNSQIFSTKRKY